MNKEKKFSVLGFFVWGIALLFFFYEFFLRVLPATSASLIIKSLDIGIQQFAVIGSAYYITYSLMQIPVGIFLDRFNPRILITIAAGLCSLGVFWFSFADGFFPAFMSRLLIGLGSSFGFVSLVYTTLNWFPKKHFAFLTGCGQFLGAIGPLAAGGPIAMLLEDFDGNWRLIFRFAAIFGFILTGLILIFFQGKPPSKDRVIFVDKKDPLLKRLKTLLIRPQVWWILLFAGMIYVSIPILGAFWGTSYLKTRGLSTASAASVISMIWIGYAVGSVVLGKFSDRMKRRKPMIALAAAIGLISGVLFLFLKMDKELLLSGILFFIGFAASGQNLAFALISEQSPKSVRATGIGLTNSSIMGTAAIMGPIVTTIIRHFTVDGKVSEMAFEKGFLILPISFGIALLVALFGIRETFCREQTTVHKVHNSYPSGV